MRILARQMRGAFIAAGTERLADPVGGHEAPFAVVRPGLEELEVLGIFVPGVDVRPPQILAHRRLADAKAQRDLARR